MTASINLQKVQVFIKESHKKMKNQFILQRINQPALGLDQISLDATINIPQSDEDEVNKVPSVEVNVDINELSQRLDVTLMRLIVRVSNQKCLAKSFLMKLISWFNSTDKVRKKLF